MSNVTTAVIPAAGLGTRLFPATLGTPKELISILDKPSIMYVLEEAAQAGIKKVILVSGPGKEALTDFFSESSETMKRLKDEKKTDLVEQFQKFRGQFEIETVMQKSPLGLGHAVLMAKKAVGPHPFLVMLPDELNIPLKGQLGPSAHLSKSFQQTGHSSVWVTVVPKADVHRYGVVDMGGLETKDQKSFRTNGLKITSLVEKPQAAKAPSLFVLPGRYVFNPSIFKFLEETKPGRLGEIQLTDAMNLLCETEELLAIDIPALRYDVGNKLGLVKTILEFALLDKEISNEVRQHFVSLMESNFGK